MTAHDRLSCSRRSSQVGATLLVGLIFLAIISLVSVYSMRTSSTQEKVTSNQRNKTVSLMAAEFGVNFITAKIDLKECTLNNLVPCTVATPSKAANLPNYNAYWITEGSPIISGNTITFTVVGTSRDSSGIEILGLSRIQFEIDVPKDEVNGRVLESEGSVTVTGRLILNGGGHTNGSWQATASNNSVSGTLTANGSISLPGVPSSQLRANVTDPAPIVLPKVEILYPVSTGPFSVDCSFTANQNLNGQTRYCKSASFAGPVSNGTIVVDSNVTISTKLSGITLIANGNIEIGAKDVVGIDGQPTTLATKGDIKALGNVGTVYGDMRANGNIELNNTTEKTTIIGQLRSPGNVIASADLELTNPVPNTPAIPTGIKKWLEVI